MHPASLEQEFMEFVEAKGHSPAKLPPGGGVDLMLNFYREVRIAECNIETDGDVLLHQWGIYDWGEGESFEFDITRQFISGEDEDILQLSLTFKFEPTADLRQLGRGNRWCHSPEQVEEFRFFIHNSPAYLAVKEMKPGKVQVEFGVAG